MKRAFFLVRSLSGFVTSLKLGINLAENVAMPMKLRTPLTDEGVCASRIAFTLAGSGDTPAAENMRPKKVIELLLNSYSVLDLYSQIVPKQLLEPCREPLASCQKCQDYR